ncbi:cytochrome P450 [Streptomyces canus]|uniref:cytochrome P450 n=1 Tax=Streptomyces canus TaxID=58343 RepID=UPI002E2BD2D5|nr:cytochrome P450 [Streptomyces canus]
MRELAGVVGMLSADQTRIGGWEQCRKALSGTELVSDASRAGLAPEPANNLLLMDGDLHKTLRRLVTAHLTRSRLGKAARRLDDVADDCVRSILSTPDPDLVTDLAEPLVLEGIMSVMEIPADRRPRLDDLTRGMLGLLEPDLPPEERRRATNAALRATMLFERDATTGRATGLHAALEQAAGEGTIPVKLARSTPVVVLHGGYENPLNQLGCLIAWAVENHQLFHTAATTAPAVLFEEIMRLYSPVRLVARWAAWDGEHGGCPVRRGGLVWVDLEGANHDPAKFSDADRIDLAKKRGHLGFGHGRHICPGAALARLEGQVLIRALLELPAELLGEFSVEWRDGDVARGPLKIVRKQR